VASGIAEIFAQFKVIKMETVRRSLTPSSSSLGNSTAATAGEEEEVTAAAVSGKARVVRDSNVTVIQIMPSERVNRRVDKEFRRMEASDLEVITVLPLTPRDHINSNFLKLHILNTRTGKIQDAIISSDDSAGYLEPQPFRKKLSGEQQKFGFNLTLN